MPAIQRINPAIEICVLAGGLSRRMGRNKALIRFGGKTMLGRIRATAKATGFPVRTISRDIIPPSGPLGGIFTALKTTKAHAVLFVACDMPFVSAELLSLFLEKANKVSPLFTCAKGQTGFPFLIPRDKLGVIEKQLAQKKFSIHKLASALRAKKIKIPVRFVKDLRNINTPQDLKSARQMIARPKK
jgi:molybdenum cofactor guanylyltransferase